MEVIEHSADPQSVRAVIERLGGELAERLRHDSALGAAFAAVVAASHSMARLLESDPSAIDVLAHLDRRQPVDPDRIVRWKQREYLRIAARDLLGVDDLEATTRAITAVATDVLRASVAVAGADDLAVIGMGKLGGNELNYASDIDVLFVGGDPKRARRVMDLARTCFRVDANLRPEGRDGPLTRSLDSYVAYWDRWARPWEFQALLKAAPVAGDAALGEAFAEAARAALWDRPFTTDDLRSLRALKERAEAEVHRAGLAEREVKRGPGGIRDIEFAVQLLQLVHGRLDVDARAPNTLAALGDLAAGAYIDPADADDLASTYRFLRRVEHALQLDEERQTHTVPDDREARRRLARVLGYRGTPQAGATEHFDSELAHRRNRARAIHERLYFQPLLDALTGVGPLPPDAVNARLAVFGFTDTERTRQAVAELTRGLNRSSRLMSQLLPLLLDWLSASPDPDLGLLGLRRLVTGEQRAMELATAFRDSPEVARHLCRLLGTSRLLGDVLVANPDLVDRLAEPRRLQTLPRQTLVNSATSATSWRDDPEERQRALQRWTRRHTLGVAARDVFGQASVEQVGHDLTMLAEATLENALMATNPQVPFAVIALGRFGGGELSYASDLDVLFVYDGDGAGAHEGMRVASELLRWVNGSTPAQSIYTLDADLRPEGKQGPLARSLDGYRHYFARWAHTWERQAMLRARPVAGDVSIGERFQEIVDEILWERPFTPDDVREVRRMKARVERERIPASDDPEFHLKLGKGSLSDVEFTVQLLQLEHRSPGTATMSALEALRAAGALDDDDARVLADAYRFCERTRNRWFLVNSAPGDALPQRTEDMAHLARSLGTNGQALRADYRRATRRARKVVERIFYGRD